MDFSRHIRAKLYSGLTRLEVLVVAGAVGLLAVVVIPCLGMDKFRSDRVTCVNNLRLIARAFHERMTEDGGLPPWLIPVNAGGLRGTNIANNLYFQYYWIRDGLGSPEILFDPADTRPNGRRATRWDGNPEGGFLHPAYQRNAVSYWIGPHALALQPASIIAGDYNLAYSRTADCFMGGEYSVFLLESQSVEWTNSVHGKQGNLAFMDGSVQQANNSELRRAIAWNSEWNNHMFGFSLYSLH